jgi:hypothetical protein
VEAGKIQSWKISVAEDEERLATSSRPEGAVTLALARNFEFTLPLAWLFATPSSDATFARDSSLVVTKLRLRFSLWQNRLPVDALPLEGWIELALLSEAELMSLAF